MNSEVGLVALSIANISFDCLQRGRMTRVGWSGAISLLSPEVTKPFVQGHKGNHKPLACQQLCLCIWDDGTRCAPRAVSLTLPRVLGRTSESTPSCHPVIRMYGPVSVNTAFCHGFHQMRFISRGIQGRRSPKSSSLIWMRKRPTGYSCLTSEKQVFYSRHRCST